MLTPPEAELPPAALDPEFARADLVLRFSPRMTRRLREILIAAHGDPASDPALTAWLGLSQVERVTLRLQVGLVAHGARLCRAPGGALLRELVAELGAARLRALLDLAPHDELPGPERPDRTLLVTTGTQAELGWIATLPAGLQRWITPPPGSPLVSLAPLYCRILGARDRDPSDAQD
ncbi:MAG: hypothetical protein ACXIU7_05140 [Roseinatronobacter sp.]